MKTKVMESVIFKYNMSPRIQTRGFCFDFSQIWQLLRRGL